MNPELSPDGSHLAYLANDEAQVLNVYVAWCGRPPKKVTHETSRNVTEYFWQMDNQHILYQQDQDGNENWHLYQVGIKDDTMRDLTPFRGARVCHISYEPSHPEEMLLSLNLRDLRFVDVYRLNLITGDLKMEIENPGNVVQFYNDHNLVVRLAKCRETDGSTVLRLRDSDCGWKSFLQWGALESFMIWMPETEVAGFSPDNQSIYLLSAKTTSTVSLFDVSLSDKTMTLLASDPFYDIHGILTEPFTHRLLAATIEREHFEYIPLEKGFAKEISKINECMNDLKGCVQVRIWNRTLDNTFWILQTDADIRPDEYWCYHRMQRTTITHLFDTKPILSQYHFRTTTSVCFRARDGLLLHGYLTLPCLKRQVPGPLVLYVHGGPWARDTWGFDSVVQWLSNRGYAVFQVNYRGSTGYGKKTENAGNLEFGRAMIHDLIDASRWAIRQGWADPRRVAMFGSSYGGYATLMALAVAPAEFCCGVDFSGPTDLGSLVENLPLYWYLDRTIWKLRMGNATLRRQQSPLVKAQFIVKPLFIAQGLTDPRISHIESDRMVNILRSLHRPIQYSTFSNEGHGWTRPQTRLFLYAEVERFLARYL